jgi:hypothetical protein
MPPARSGSSVSESLWTTLAAILLLVVVLLGPGHGSRAHAAEVLQVRGPTLLQLGDRNRSYSVELVCLEVPPTQSESAVNWLRKHLPRRTRVNLQPLGEHDGLLMARVQPLNDESDLASALISAGLAQPAPCPWG